MYNLSPQRTLAQRRRDEFIFRRLLSSRNYSSRDYFEPKPKADPGGLPRVKPEWMRLLESVAALGSSEFRLPIPAEAQVEANRALNGHIDATGAAVAFCPGSKMPAKRWGADNYAESARRLLAEYPDCKLVFLGGPEDAPLCDALVGKLGPRAKNLAGELTLFGSAAVLRRCKLYVGNDTGTMHLAAAVGTRCIAVFSARDYPGLWEPFGKGHTVLRTSLECEGCMLETCSQFDGACLSRITVEQVLGAVRESLPRSTLLS